LTLDLIFDILAVRGVYDHNKGGLVMVGKIGLYAVLCVFLFAIVSVDSFAVQSKLLHFSQVGFYINHGIHATYCWVINENGGGEEYVSILSRENETDAWEDRGFRTEGSYQFWERPGYCEPHIDNQSLQYRLPINCEVTPWMHTESPLPNCYHYSWDMIWIKVTEQDKWTFPNRDQFYMYAQMGLNTATSEATNHYGDQYELGAGDKSSVGQTFVAKGNRILAIRVQVTKGVPNHMAYKAEIRRNGPTGSLVAPIKESRDMAADEFWPVLVTYAKDECIVEPGQTY